MRPDRTYPEPYVKKQAWLCLRQEIRENGFIRDPYLYKNPDLPVFGINLAMGWPLPSPLKKPYERLAKALSALDTGLYVYPYRYTHITIMTLVNFQDFPNPTQEEKHTLQQLLPKIISLVSSMLSPESGLNLKPFHIDIGLPVLSRKAAFLPILNLSNEVFRLRAGASKIFKKEGILHHTNVPDVIHSTILRFVDCPQDSPRFLKSFESTVLKFRSQSNKEGLGKAAINELLLTAETRPYMRGGKILYRLKLKE